jgi:hypothetical protein
MEGGFDQGEEGFHATAAYSGARSSYS